MSATTELVARIALKWIEKRPFSKEARARRKAKRAAERSEVVQSDEVSMLQGRKTYIGIATAALGVLLGWVGLGEAESAALSSQLVGAVDQLLTVGGLLFAAYGRAKAKPAA